MKSRKIPKDFGDTLVWMINEFSKDKLLVTLAEMVTEVIDGSGLERTIPRLPKKRREHLLAGMANCALPIVIIGIMVGYQIGRNCKVIHPLVIKDLDYLTSQMPFLEDLKGNSADEIIQKCIDAKEGKAKVTQQEIEALIDIFPVAADPKKKKALVDRIKSQIPTSLLVS